MLFLNIPFKHKYNILNGFKKTGLMLVSGAFCYDLIDKEL